jgi:hypothetical protein
MCYRKYKIFMNYNSTDTLVLPTSEPEIVYLEEIGRLLQHMIILLVNKVG